MIDNSIPSPSVHLPRSDQVKLELNFYPENSSYWWMGPLDKNPHLRASLKFWQPTQKDCILPTDMLPGYIATTLKLLPETSITRKNSFIVSSGQVASSKGSPGPLTRKNRTSETDQSGTLAELGGGLEDKSPS